MQSKKIRLEFWLARHSGKKMSLKKGNQMMSMNDSNLNWHVRSDLEHYLRGLSYHLAKSTGVVPKTPYSPEKPCTVKVTIYKPTKRRSDADNWARTVKPLKDGLTDAGVWTDDNDDVIKCTSYLGGELSGRNKYKFVFEIEDY